MDRFLPQRGGTALDIRIIEAKHSGYGASGRADGFVTPTIGKDIQALVKEFGPQRALEASQAVGRSILDIGRFARRNRIDAQYEANDYLMVATDAAQVRRLEEDLRLAERMGAAQLEILPSWNPPDLSETVAVVTGASRGVGRGIALALGSAGATVYVTGRSTRDGARTEDLPGTVDDTADEVTRRGGKGVAVRCDHGIPADNAALFERVNADHGRLDLLVNNAWGGYERSSEVRFDAPFWDQPMWRYDLFEASLRAQFDVTRRLVPLMLPQHRGLIVGISFSDGDIYLGQVGYDVFKSASDRMCRGFAADLRKRGIAAVSLHPGFVRTERVEAAWAAMGDGPASVVHSPEYVGRAIAALFSDPEVMERSGKVLSTGDLAVEYGFGDVDGRQPPAFRLEGRMSLATRMHRLNKVVAARSDQ
ncbi:SDR family NAD(P)-dependent oxidoreductase [Streptomyces sp. NPDC051976]|uniref:SDR family NAD(P)-dependent oxidoreductase n=1 Tax=Streptomyces sp. NPDC051976 TaxID=3154947 RepID=UPI00342DE56F